MWLINTETLQLRSFQGKPPRYAILSHRWGSDEDEVTFQDWRADHANISTRPGYIKIVSACEQAKQRGLEYLWVDTSCIDKSSSAELSEAINSMYRYYKQAQVCFAYLQDVDDVDTNLSQDPSPDLSSQFCQSSWFTRGWTLQELLAPRDIDFFNSSWAFIGTKNTLNAAISVVTRIPAGFLLGRPLHQASISTRMSWASNRVTTRLEDIAYCMLGIFEIHMPLLYGEGRQAFQRLQEELMKSSDDQSIFAWDWLPRFTVAGRSASNFPRLRCSHLIDSGWDIETPTAFEGLDFLMYKNAESIGLSSSSMLSPDPIFFYASSGVGQPPAGRPGVSAPYFTTNKGLSITLPIYHPEYALSGGSGAGFREQQPLAMVTVCHSILNRRAVQIGIGVFLGLLDHRTSAYTRARHWDFRPYDDQFFRGHIMAVMIPWNLFEKYFRPKAIFAPRSLSIKSIFGWDQTPEVAVWLLNGPETEHHPQIELLLPRLRRPDPRDWHEHMGSVPLLLLKRGRAANGAIFKVTYAHWNTRKKPPRREAFILVRATRNDDFISPLPASRDIHDGGWVENQSFRWRCDEVSLIKGSPTASDEGVWWRLHGKEVTLQEALDHQLPEDPKSFAHESKCFLGEARGLGTNTPHVTVRLEGAAFWLTNPHSSMKFLHAAPYVKSDSHD